jgi:hypothetical protein
VNNKGSKPVLYIDTTVVNEITLALVSGLHVKRFTPAIGSGERDNLLCHVDKLLTRNKSPLIDLTAIVVVRGPGSFTATRVGVTVANALGLALNVPVYGVKQPTQPDLAKLIAKVLKLSPSRESIRPYYDRPPNITQPKNKTIDRLK